MYTPILLKQISILNKDLGVLHGNVNMVITLTAQERMKKDPEYGHAVNHLRTRQCGLDDVELFNPGINMSVNGNDDACAIVNTNLL